METRIKKTLSLIIIYILYFSSTSYAEVSLFTKDTSCQLAPVLQVNDIKLKFRFKTEYNIGVDDVNLGQIVIEDVPLYFRTIFNSIFFDKSEGLVRLKNVISPESEKFLLRSVNLIDRGALKRIFKVVVETDKGEVTFGMRFYFLLRSKERGQFDPSTLKEVFQKALAEKDQLSVSYESGGLGINIYEYIDRNQLDPSIDSLLSQNSLVGFTVGEYVIGYSLDKVDDLEELQSLLRENVITITQEWFLSLSQERKSIKGGNEKGFLIRDLKPSNFVYDTGTNSKKKGRVRYIDADKPRWVGLSNLFIITYEYIKNTLNEKEVLLGPYSDENFVIEEIYFRSIMRGLQEGFATYLATRWENLKETGEYQEEAKQINRLRKILSKNLVDQSQGEKKIQNLKNNKWEIKLQQSVLKEAASDLIALLEEFEYKLGQEIGGGSVVQIHSPTNTTAVMLNSAI